MRSPMRLSAAAVVLGVLPASALAQSAAPPLAMPLPAGGPSAPAPVVAPAPVPAPAAAPAPAVAPLAAPAGYPANYAPAEQPRRPIRGFFRRLWSGDKVEPLHMAGVQTPHGKCSCGTSPAAVSAPLAAVPAIRPVPSEPVLSGPVVLSEGR